MIFTVIVAFFSGMPAMKFHDSSSELAKSSWIEKFFFSHLIWLTNFQIMKCLWVFMSWIAVWNLGTKLQKYKKSHQIPWLGFFCWMGFLIELTSDFNWFETILERGSSFDYLDADRTNSLEFVPQKKSPILDDIML